MTMTMTTNDQTFLFLLFRRCHSSPFSRRLHIVVVVLLCLILSIKTLVDPGSKYSKAVVTCITQNQRSYSY